MIVPYCPLTPTTHQAAWLHNRDRIATFVGGRGSGRSMTLIMAALQDVSVPGYRAIIFYQNSGCQHFWRDRLDKWWEDNPELRYFASGNWIFPHGSQIYLRVLPTPGTVARYKSTEWNFMGFEDVDSYTERHREVEEHLATRARGKGNRIRSTYNDYETDPFLDSWTGP